MQAIGFNEHYGLQTAVIEKWKTMTRRFEKGLENLEEGNFCFNKAKGEIYLYGEKGTIIETIKTRYKIGEVVAIKQCYRDIIDQLPDRMKEYVIGYYSNSEAWTNKMFIRPDLMPRHIRITDIKVERLQDISDEDCMKEGILHWKGSTYENLSTEHFHFRGCNDTYSSSTEAFAHLIDKVSKKGTWERNPYVPAYSFELID